MINFNLVSGVSSDNSLKTSGQNKNEDFISFDNFLKNDSDDTMSLSDESIEDFKNVNESLKSELESVLEDLNLNIDENSEDLVEDLVVGLFVYSIIENRDSFNTLDSSKFENLNMEFKELLNFFSSNSEKTIEIKEFIKNDESIKDLILSTKIELSELIKLKLKIEDGNKFVIVNSDKVLNKHDELLNTIAENMESIAEICLDEINNSNSNEIKRDKDNSNSKMNFILEEISKIEDLVSVVSKNSKDILDYNESSSGYSKFLLNQRINLKGVSNEDIKSKIEMISDLKSNNEVNIGLSQYTYRTDVSINDKINSIVTPGYVREQYFVKDVVKVVSNMNSNNLNELTLKVKPKELGEISIHLTKNSNLSEVVIIVENDELFDNTKRNLLEISAQLKDMGMKVDNVTVQMKNNNQSANMDFMTNSDSNNYKNNSSKNNSKKLKGSDLDEIEDKSIDCNEGEINVLA